MPDTDTTPDAWTDTSPDAPSTCVDEDVLAALGLLGRLSHTLEEDPAVGQACLDAAGGCARRWPRPGRGDVGEAARPGRC